MKNILLVLLCMLFTAGSATAYVEDKAMVLSEWDGDADANNLAAAYEMLLATKMGNRFPCLVLIRMNDIAAQIGWARMQQLVGTPEEKQINLKNIGDAMGVKYLIKVTASHMKDNPRTWINIRVLNNLKQTGIYNDMRQFSSPSEAADGVDEMIDRLEKGFAEHLSMQKDGYGEICPFTGRVDVYREVKRDRYEKKSQDLYCKGMDMEGHELEKYSATLQEVWSLERFGNPDTRGGVDATFLEETVSEEVNPCYVCGPDEIARWVWNRTATVSGAINGLSDKSAGESIKNKDATIRLHFTKDGTYTVTVKAASNVGKQTKTVKESAVGLCNTFTRNEPQESAGPKLGLEYTFGPFAGTPFDTKLAQQLEVKVPPQEVALDMKEETILRIDFELERAGDK